MRRAGQGYSLLRATLHDADAAPVFHKLLKLFSFTARKAVDLMRTVQSQQLHSLLQKVRHSQHEALYAIQLHSRPAKQRPNQSSKPRSQEQQCVSPLPTTPSPQRQHSPSSPYPPWLGPWPTRAAKPVALPWSWRATRPAARHGVPRSGRRHRRRFWHVTRRSGRVRLGARSRFLRQRCKGGGGGREIMGFGGIGERLVELDGREGSEGQGRQKVISDIMCGWSCRRIT